MDVNWKKCSTGTWCGLSTVNLNSKHFDGMVGVYIIWQKSGPIIKVGQGIIKDRLSEHRRDSEINSYDNLFATWAEISSDKMDGVENYLSSLLTPRVGNVFPDATPIEVNPPWDY